MPQPLALLPLRAVLFPGGLLRLTVATDPAMALLRRCHLEGLIFGVTCLQDEQATAAIAATVGVMARVESLVAHEATLRVSCLGRRRFRVVGARYRDGTGQWHCQASAIADDAEQAPGPTMFATVQTLARSIASLRISGELCMNEPFHLNDAGWVANRWCELLPISLAAKQRLMALTDPQVRLALVDAYLREQRIVR